MQDALDNDNNDEEDGKCVHYQRTGPEQALTVVKEIYRYSFGCVPWRQMVMND